MLLGDQCICGCPLLSWHSVQRTVMIYLEICCVISPQPLLRGRKCRSLALRQQQQMWCIQLFAFILVVSVQCIQKQASFTLTGRGTLRPCGSAIKSFIYGGLMKHLLAQIKVSLFQFILPACLQNPPTFVQMNPASNPDYFNRAILFCSYFSTSVSQLNSTFECITNSLDLIWHCRDLCCDHLLMMTNRSWAGVWIQKHTIFHQIFCLCWLRC